MVYIDIIKMDSFYMTLPSNVMSDGFNNTVANFKSKLASRIDLKGNWEVGLVEASYTYSWYNLMNKEQIYLRYFDKGIITSRDFVEVIPTRFDSIEDLLKHINSEIDRVFKPMNLPLPIIQYNKGLNRVFIDNAINNNTLVHLKISSGLCALLSIDKKKLDDDTTKVLLKTKKTYDGVPDEIKPMFTFSRPDNKDVRFWSDRQVSFSSGIRSLFLYCDIVKHSFVGDSFSQLLRIIQIPPKSRFGDQIVLTYSNPQYFPLIANEFESIELHLKDDTNSTIPFQFGRSIFVLHFRRINKSN